MELKNVESRPSEVRKSGDIGDFEGESGVVGDAAKPSAKHGSYKVGTSREDRNQSNTLVPGEQPLSGIPGKIVSQLIEEIEKQLAYHEQQAELLRERLQELKQTPINDTQ